MRVLIYTAGSDTGGQGHRIASAFRDVPGWHVDARTIHAHPFGYPMQRVNARERTSVIGRLYAEADVVHLRHDLGAYREFDKGQGKPIVLHFHGSDLRLHPAKQEMARRIGAVQVVSTLDLTFLGPDLHWVPSPYPVNELAAKRAQEYEPSQKVRIAYFPTSPKVKSLDAFMAAYERLRERYDVALLTNVHHRRIVTLPHKRVMDLKVQADILFDQVTLGYGNNAIEAMALGIPVIAGAADPRVRALMVERFGELPFLEATEATIHDALVQLVESPAMRQEYGQRGREHADRFHSEKAVVSVLSDIYRSAKPTHAWTGAWPNTRLPQRAA